MYHRFKFIYMVPLICNLFSYVSIENEVLSTSQARMQKQLHSSRKFTNEIPRKAS